MRHATYLLFGALIVVFGLLSCGDDATNPEDTTLFTVKVVDTLGMAVEGIRIGSMNHSTIFDFYGSTEKRPCGSMRFSFEIAQACYGELILLNVYHTALDTITFYASAGLNEIVFDAGDLIPGFYYYHLITRDTLDNSILSDTEKVMIYETAPDPAQSVMGTTNVDGIYTTDSVLYFPVLLANQPDIDINFVDEYGNIDSTVTVTEFYSDTVTITLSDPATPDAFILIDKQLSRSGNYFELTWDPTETVDTKK
ncbi:MAG: hypothetical protein JW763_03130 [candidate division Zixibacteria bacterium]|nr:hypothetical protein [candidate division Zixibacteria bacterium]